MPARAKNYLLKCSSEQIEAEIQVHMQQFGRFLRITWQKLQDTATLGMNIDLLIIYAQKY